MPQLSGTARGRREGAQRPGNGAPQPRVTVQKASACSEIAGARGTPQEQ